MKSIALIVLLALVHASLGQREVESTRMGGYKIYRQNDGKPILISADEDGNDDSEVDTETTDSVDRSVEEHQRYESHERSHEHIERSHEHIERSHGDDDKDDCDCKKNKPKITYGPEQIVKGKPETFIHHQPKIIVRQPPTHVRIEHAPTVIQPRTIVFRRDGKTIRKPVIYQHLPQDVRVQPIVVKVVRPIEKKVLVESKPASCPKLAQQYKEQHHKNDEYETESYGGETYSESFDSHESLRGHLNMKETTSVY